MADRKYQLPDPVTGRWVDVTKEQYDAAINASRTGGAGGSTNTSRTPAPVVPPTRSWSPPPMSSTNGFSSMPSAGSFGSRSTPTTSTPGYGGSTYGTDGMMEGDGGGWGWLGDAGGWLERQLGSIDAGDWLSAGGAAIGGYMDAKQSAAALAQREAEFQRQLEQRKAEMGMSGEQFEKTLGQRQAEEATRSGEFDRTTGNSEAQLNVQAQTALNKAPMADKAQALLLSRMGAAPTAFKPRDWTAKLSNIEGEATGGPADSLAAGQRAAAAYTPGAGGVDTSALKLLQQRMLASGKPQNPGVVPRIPTVPGVSRPGVAARPTRGPQPSAEPDEESLTRPGTYPVSRRPMAFR